MKKVFNKDEVYKQCDNEIINAVLRPLNTDFKDALDYWFRDADNCISIPFYDENSSKSVYVPYNMLKAYGSNGMAAGNGKDEAFVQAVSEIFERHCLKEIVLKEICPPTIDREYIHNQYSLIDKMLNDIEYNNGISCIVKDCSMNTGFPVVAICVYDQNKHTDSVSFGSHPNEEIAIERAFTELFQGRSIDDISNDVANRSKDQRYNILSILKNGIGYFPYKFHSESADYQVNYFKGNAFVSNHDAKKYVLDICKKNGLNIYSRYVKIGNMVDVQVVIPNFSEVFTYDSFQFKCIKMKKQLNKEFSALDKLNPTKLQTYLEFIDFSRKIPEFDLNLSKSFAASELNAGDDLLCILISGFYHLGMYDRCLNYVETAKKTLPLEICSCLFTIINLKKQRFSDVDIQKISERYFEPAIIDQSNELLSFSFQLKKCSAEETVSYLCSDSWLDCVRNIKDRIELI